MAIETSYTFRASAKGFAEVGREIDALNKKVAEGEKAIQRVRKERPGQGALPQAPGARVPPRPRKRPDQGTLPQAPGTRVPPGTRSPQDVVLPPGVVWRPGHGPKAQTTTGQTSTLPTPDTGDGGGGGGGGPKRRRGIKGDPAALKKLDQGFVRATRSAERLVQTVMDVNSAINDALPSFREFAQLYRDTGRGGRGSGGGGSGGGGGGPRGPRAPAPPGGGSGGGGSGGTGALLQGFLEALIPGIGMMQRGPGMAAQFGGRLLGGAARSTGNFVRQSLMAPMSGVQGVQNAINSVPLVGGMLGAVSGQMFGNAGTAIGFEGQQMAALPYLGRTGVNAQYLGAPRHRGLFDLSQLSQLGLSRAGMGTQQSQQFLATLAQASGGTADNPLVGGMTGTALSAYSRYGVGPEIAGLFAQGSRLQGGQGVGAQGFVRSLAQAQQGMGLSGTELTDYMRQMAEDIASFKDTGIPLRTDTIGALGSTLAQSGIAGARAGALSNNFVRNAQNVGMEGPQSVEDFALLQASAGRPLTGIDDTLSAMESLEQGQSPAQARATFNNLRAFAKDRYGNDKKGQFQQRQFLGRYGVRLNSREFRNLGSGNGADLSDQQLQGFSQNMSQGAADNVSGVVGRQSGLDNANLNLGMKGLDSYFMAEQTSKAIAQGVVEGINPYVTQVTKAVTGLYDFVLGQKSGQMASSPSAAVGR